MTTHIGIVGVSPEGTALFYRQLTRASGRMLGPDRQPRISVHNEPLGLYIDAIRRDDWHAVGRLLRRSADLLHRCGAQLCVTPDNAIQHAVSLAEVGSPVPWLTTTEIVAEVVAEGAHKKVGLIGTKLVTGGSAYQTHLGLRGAKVVPPDAADSERLDRIIFDELIYGQIRDESRLFVAGLTNKFADRGCDAVIVALSEAPLLLDGSTSRLPVLDASDILAAQAIKRLPDFAVVKA